MNDDRGVPELQGPPEVLAAIDEFLADVERALPAKRPERKMLRAPWTPEQVKALNAFQHLGSFHPYTCLRPHEGTARYLVATQAGWVCKSCDYTQNWAHSRAVTLGEGALRG